MKKIFIFIRIKPTCILVLLLFCLCPLLAEPCGDVNSDGSIDILDALLIAQYYVDLDPPNFDESAADVNCDGIIDILDALMVARYYVGIIQSLSCCEPTPTPAPTPAPTEIDILSLELLNEAIDDIYYQASPDFPVDDVSIPTEPPF